MVAEIKAILTRSQPTMVEDMAGAATLFLLLFVGLAWIGIA